MSSDGDYRYESWTGWDALMEISARSLGFDGWVEFTGGGFR